MIQTWRDIPGFFDFEDIYDLAAAEARPGDTLVEVGSFLGKSAAYLNEAVLKLGKQNGVLCVDSWDPAEYKNWWIDVRRNPPAPWPVEELYGKPLDQAFDYCIRSTPQWENIITLSEASVPAALSFPDAFFSFVFIDADHRYEAIRADIEAWAPKVRSGGVFAGHDYRVKAWPGVTKAVDEAFPQGVQHLNNSWLVRL